ncbi:TetR family transcriptional regulator C-terminal domain-containing protein [Rhizobiaceae bacterium n13]|uniref:TetR family transcriptional regulator C-terminal domain-containing protein n=1 Tax=Ferirhizobium litorale TaxID=2927786 RepID=A0AAE3QB76_9HYPH|nr:TetR family transcriptional regulator C-terminal domain-containing protein [Fererhizobium litorale]MDI7862130.1 TetR family transcriptional regulator C-terminal domain-containing protein [Fererhizobium litorale]MDI7922597.1 TetR family transcriptional regulator C-terminal domain-containing protein [Fererhizobium litorale]
MRKTNGTKQAVKVRARFRRETPEDRRRQLGEAALRCIVKHGNAGVSVRQIAAEAGVTQGLITHHFGEINELVAYAFDIMSDGILQNIMEAVDAAPGTPRARLDAFIDTSFSPILFDRDVLGVWVVFWGLILHSPRMSASQQGEYSTYVVTVEGLIRDLAAAENFSVGDVRLTAIAFTALLDGLWLAWCLNPAAFKPEEGVKLCHNWVEGLRRGAYA